MNEHRRGLPVHWIALAVLIWLLLQASQPMQRALPSYDGNTWSSQVHTEDNDTNVCIGWCADQGQ
jgi:hypothetical protein